MGKKQMRQSVHDGLVKELHGRLFQTHGYEHMWLFWEYCKNGQVGEVDLLAMADEHYDFYEVKCTFHSKSSNKAHEQYERFQLAFPEWEMRGFLYTGDSQIRSL